MGKSGTPFLNRNTDSKLKRGNRKGDSFDTGLDGENNSRFLLIKSDISSGVCSPSVRQIMKRYKSNYVYARDVLAELAKQGLLIRDEATGQYRLN